MKIATGEQKAHFTLRDHMALRHFKNFNATSEEEYSDNMKRMTLAQLQNHAVSNAVRPGYDRKRLEDTLKKEFRKALRNYDWAMGKLE